MTIPSLEDLLKLGLDSNSMGCDPTAWGFNPPQTERKALPGAVCSLHFPDLKQESGSVKVATHITIVVTERSLKDLVRKGSFTLQQLVNAILLDKGPNYVHVGSTNANGLMPTDADMRLTILGMFSEGVKHAVYKVLNAMFPTCWSVDPQA